MVLHKTGYRYSRVGIGTHLGYRYSIRVSVLKNHSRILEVFQNVTGYRYSVKGIGYRYPKGGIDTQMHGRQFLVQKRFKLKLECF
ncbi:hypothetical protein GQ457_02G025060 [Hibiscus cannabinus]